MNKFLIAANAAVIGANIMIAAIRTNKSINVLETLSIISVVRASRTPFLTCSRLLSRVDLKAAGIPAIPAYIQAFIISPVEEYIDMPNNKNDEPKINFTKDHIFFDFASARSAEACFRLQS